MKFKLSKKNITIGSIILLFLIIIIIRFTGNQENGNYNVTFANKEKKLRDDEYGFEMKYKGEYQEKSGQLIFQGADKKSKIFWTNIYENQQITEVIDEFKKQIKGEITEEKDVKINTCTARKITLITSQGRKHYYFFISKGTSTIRLDWEYTDNEEDNKLIDEMMAEFTCL